NNTFSPMRFVQAHEVRQISATGYYYSGTNFNTYRGSRNDSKIDFEWFEGGPGIAGVGTDHFSVYWSGTINVPRDGWYAFFATADDGVRVWLDNRLIIDKWQDQPPYTYQAIRYLNAGDHNVRVEYYERGGGATIKVAWKPVSRVLLATGWEDGQTLGYSNRIEYRANVAGWYGNESPPPECSRRQEIRRGGVGWSEMIAGQDMSASQNSYCYYRVFEDNIEIREGTMIAFWMYHDTSYGANATATRRVSVDGATTDGLTLRDFDNGAGWQITDQQGVRIHPAMRNGPINEWYYVEVDLTPMAGRVLDYIMFAYDDNAVSEVGRYRTYVDDFYVFWP
ncbi:MAG: PA14 domain-containing protein, partial [Anaerolineae bacterium]|nr:PA14 domain-containing protein [Anaerolineae bacterium]